MLKLLLKLFPTRPIYAHCDIPCGIYDPHEMQLAAHTIIRMVNLINESAGGSATKDDNHKVVRCIKVKEEHAGKVEHEVVTLWADYFKEEHLKDYPDLHDLVWKTLKLTGDVRQKVDLAAAQKLLENTQKIAEIFWKTKGIAPIRIPSGYPTEGEIVSHQ